MYRFFKKQIIKLNFLLFKIFKAGQHMKNNIHVVLWPINTHTHIALTVGQAMKGVTFPQTLRHAIFFDVCISLFTVTSDYYHLQQFR